MLKHRKHARYNKVKHDVECGFIQNRIFGYDFFCASFQRKYEFFDKIRIAFDGNQVLIKVRIAVDYARKLLIHQVGVAKNIVDIVLANDFFEVVDNCVFDFADKFVDAVIIIVECFAVDVGSVGNIFDCDVVDVFSESSSAKAR